MPPLKVLHLSVTSGGGLRNSGDFMIYKSIIPYCNSHIFEEHKEVEWSQRCIRQDIPLEVYNSYDAIVVGPGGLILPDSVPNKVSGWQWVCPLETLKAIEAKIYVVSIGWNLFFGQKVTMPRHDSDFEEPWREDLLRSHLSLVLQKATHFSMRHTGDIRALTDFIDDPSLTSKVTLEMCPTIWYAKHIKLTYDHLSLKPTYYAFEVKDDRPHRRFFKIGRKAFYEALWKTLKHVKDVMKKPVVILSHDGSSGFASFVRSKPGGKGVPTWSNASSNQDAIMKNYLRIHTLFATAGHSQMIGWALGIRVISLVTHPKLRHFLEDVGEEDTGIEVNEKGDGLFEIIRKIIK